MQLALTGSNMFFGVAAISYGSVRRTETLMLTKESNSFREGAHSIVKAEAGRRDQRQFDPDQRVRDLVQIK